MARQQVLSPLPQNQGKSAHASKQRLGRTMMRPQTRVRSDSLSSLSSTSSQDSSILPGSRQSGQQHPSSSVSPDENRVKGSRVSGMPFVEMFSPVRALRAARAGMKRKRGGGPLVVASSRKTVFHRGEGSSKQASTSRDAGREPASGRQIRGSRRTVSRDATNASLRRGMIAMVLTDNEPESSAAGPAAPGRKVSGSGSVRSTRSRVTKPSQEDSEEEVIDDAEEDERLLLHAPSWQLHRLKKTKLFKLHVLLGTWNEGEVVDLDLYNKQELVEGLIKARSSTTTERTLISSQSSPPLSRKSAPKRSLTSSTLHSRSSTYTDEESTASETEANDGGGEETEAEPAKAARRREDLRLTRIYNVQGISSPMINRLRRARTRLPNPAADSRFGREVLAKGSTTSIASSGVSSPLGRRLRNSKSTVFAASSPARTRLRTQNMPSSSSMRHPLAANRSAVAQNVFPRRMEDRTPRQRRQKRMASKKSVAFGRYSEQETNESGEEEDNKEWEDASPTSLRRYSLNPPRQAKVRAQEQLHQLHDGLDDMSVDETPTKATLKVQPAAYTHSQPLQNDTVSDLSAEENGEEGWEEESHASETDVNASPSKIRKLRNGKIRLSTANTANQRRGEDADDDDDDDTGALVEEEDVDMENAEDATDVLMDVPTASSLYRLLRCQLVRLCEKHGADVAKDATKAALIETLLQTEAFQHRAPGSSRTAMPDSNSTVSSTSAGRSKAAKANGKSSRRRSDKPLLLRSQSNEVQRDKPPSPIPSHGQGGAQQHLATGEDELNGLDLESLNLVDKEIPFSKLEKLEKIGSGGFKDVYIGKYQISKKTTKRVAIADIRDQLSEMDIKELTLLRDLKHENIVRFIGVCVPPPDMRMTPCMIVSELCTNGDLFDYVRNVEAPPDEEIFRIMLETARGLEYLHTRTPAIIHRDCKSTNVLVTRNKTAKINDFGLARVRNTKRSMIKSLVGTVNWQAVELWSPKPNYNEKVDVWSAGMTFWETLQWHQAEKKYPFQEMNEHQIYLDVGHKKLRPSTVSIRRHYGGEIVDLLDRMWDHNPKERPTMTEVCERMEELVEGKRQASQARRAAQ